MSSIHFDLPLQQSSIIKVIGIGGGGSNAVNHMFNEKIEGVDFIVCNTDAKALSQSPVPNKIHLGPSLTQGLGAGANPEVGRRATEESMEELKKMLEVNTKMVFLTAGMGGGTGTGGAPILAKICKDLGLLTVAIVTMPFSFEGPRRLSHAQEGIRQLSPFVDTLLIISNDKISMHYGESTFSKAFAKADSILTTAAKCITNIIQSKGRIIVDFADVCTVMRNGGVAVLSSAEAEGPDRASRIVEMVLDSPLLNDSDIRGAKWILLNIESNNDDSEYTMEEINFIGNQIRNQAGEQVEISMGLGWNTTLDKKISITLIATGFHQDKVIVNPYKEMPSASPQKVILPWNANANANKEEDIEVYKEGDKKQMPFSVMDQQKQPQEVTPSSYISNSGVVKKPSHIYMNEVEKKEVEKSPVNIPVDKNELVAKEKEATVSNELPYKITYKEEGNKKMNVGLKKKIPNDKEAESVQGELNFVYHDEGVIRSEDKKETAANENEVTPSSKRKDILSNMSFFSATIDPQMADFSHIESVPAFQRKQSFLSMTPPQPVSQDAYKGTVVEKDEKGNLNISTVNNFLEGKKPD